MKPTQEHVPWGWLTAIGLPLAHIAIQIALTLSGSGVLLLVLWTTSRLNSTDLTTWATSGVFVGLIGTLGGLISLGLIYAVVTRLRKRPFRATIRLIKGGHLWLAALGAVLLGGVMDTATLALHKPVVPEVLRPMFAGFASVVTMTLFAVLVTPLVEELLFRGVLYPVAARSFGVASSVAVVSLVFGLAHTVTYGFDIHLVAQALIAGFYLTWLRARTGSLVPSIAAHATLNLYATVEAVVVVNLLK
jgi:membrane protease YdiL (CAAX protease family)